MAVYIHKVDGNWKKVCPVSDKITLCICIYRDHNLVDITKSLKASDYLGYRMALLPFLLNKKENACVRDHFYSFSELLIISWFLTPVKPLW